MDHAEQPIRQPTDEEMRRALRRYFRLVDTTLAAAAEAKKAQARLERLSGRSVKEVAKDE